MLLTAPIRPPQAATAYTPGALPRQGLRSSREAVLTLDAVGWRVCYGALRRSLHLTRACLYHISHRGAA